MLSLSATHNPNYIAKVVQLKNLQKHPNADKLQVAIVDFQNVIVGPNAKDGDICVFVPLECTIMADFLSATNSYRDKDFNADKTVAGFFEKKGRVRAVKLRGEKSMGYIIPIDVINEYFGTEIGENDIGKEFDSIDDILFCKKYVLPSLTQLTNVKQGKKPRVSRVVEGQVHLHVDTEQLRKNAYKVKPDDEISITYKLHGTSGWIAHVMGNRKLSLLDKICKFFGAKIDDKEYDYFYGSRKVIKNQYETQGKQDFYGYDIWEGVKNDLKDYVPKGFSVYYEIVGYTKDGGMIQKDYDYGVEIGQHKVYIYRITFTNADGIVTELTTKEVQEYCQKFNLNYVPLFYTGKAKDYAPDLVVDDSWTEKFLQRLVDNFTEKDCFMCKNKLPEEGVVLRRESIFQFEAYKLKSFAFLARESEELDKGVTNLEDNQ